VYQLLLGAIQAHNETQALAMQDEISRTECMQYTHFFNVIAAYSNII